MKSFLLQYFIVINIMSSVCREFMEHRCNKDNCKFIHDKNLCYYFWRNGSCKWGDECRKNHFVTEKPNPPRRVKNTETFEPNYNPPDMRVLVEFGKQKCEAKLQTQDVLLVPDFFPNQGDGQRQLRSEDRNRMWSSFSGVVLDGRIRLRGTRQGP